MEACRVVIQERAPGVFDVGAPMKHKPLCYDILKDAGIVIASTSEQHFHTRQGTLTIVMGISGMVNVAAPLPPREKCYLMLRHAKDIIERFDDDRAPVMRAFSDQLVGG
jgi:hypothetical protein